MMHDESTPTPPSTPATPDGATASTPGPVPSGPVPFRAEPDAGTLEGRVLDAIKTVFDPEIPVNIYELGLIYDLAVAEEGKIDVIMTLTSPSCPVAGTLPGDVETRIKGVKDVTEVKVDLTWEPAWNPDMMTEAAKLQLGML